jgi:hypothetical protein
MMDFPKRQVSLFCGEDGRSAIVWQNLNTREYIVERKATDIKSGFNNKYTNAADAEDSAEDWVMKQ